MFEIDDLETVYTYGNAIYDPREKQGLSGAVITHEMRHMMQQEEIGKDEWWKQYLADPAFRLKQEMEAYQAQYLYYCRQDRDRNNQAKYLNTLSYFASSPMYKMEITQQEAIKLIRNK